MQVQNSGDLVADFFKGKHRDATFIILHETVWSSILKDTFTFSAIGFVTLVNHTLGWDSWVVDLVGILFVLLWLFRKDQDPTFRLTKQELIETVRRLDAQCSSATASPR